MKSTRRRFIRQLGAAAPLTLSLTGRSAHSAPTDRATLLVSERVLRPSVPDHFFSFNLNSISLDSDYWDPRTQALHATLVASMKAFPGAFYRYPGGNIGNHLAWEWAMGDAAGRRPQVGVAHLAAKVVRFGPREYFEFLAAVGGRSWYTLNLVGWDEAELAKELPSELVADSNGRLARLRAQIDLGGGPHYYHLGNELDRNRYRWPVDKYIARCRDSMAAVRAADPQARFVAFLRDFNLSDRGNAETAQGIVHAERILAGLPEIDDVSLQVYYDRPASEGARFDLGWRWRLVDSFLQALPRIAGRPVTTWVTEHAQAMDTSARGLSRPARLATTSGISGAVASADFCIGALHRPALAGTFWHALAGGVWWDLFNPADGGAAPTPAYRAFKLLREHSQGEVMQSVTRGAAVASYAGGYDLSCAALRGPADHGYTVWAANRSGAPVSLDIVIPALAKQALRLRTASVAATAGLAAARELQVDVHAGDWAPAVAGSDGRVTVLLPARCVAAVRVVPAGTTN